MKRNIILFFLFITISHSSFASIITYNLFAEAYLIDDGLNYELNGFIAFESVGTPEIWDNDITQTIRYVNFNVIDFFLASPKDVLINSQSERNTFKFMCTDLIYHGDRMLCIYPDANERFSWISEVPEDGSLFFAPKTFDILNLYMEWSPYKFFELHAISTVDETSTFTLTLFGLLLIFVIAMNKRPITKNF
ncbi:MAG: hypothetical protein JW915_14705 [Chitinispirillaceae bacterium]|nr:hypothetical protein [Chitinispirillaceae bacterium]